MLFRIRFRLFHYRRQHIKEWFHIGVIIIAWRHRSWTIILASPFSTRWGHLMGSVVWVIDYTGGTINLVKLPILRGIIHCLFIDRGNDAGACILHTAQFSLGQAAFG